MKLTDLQKHHLKVLSEQKGPMLGYTLADRYVGIRMPTFDSLVRSKLVRVRKTEGRQDRYEILAAGRAALCQK
jgi:hypothetical protein